MKKIKKIISLLFVCLLLAQSFIGVKVVNAANGETTIKAGMEIKVINSDNEPVSNVSFTVNYNGQTITVGPSDSNGIAKSSNNAFQLYDKVAYSTNYGNIFKQKENITITVDDSTVPEQYEFVTFTPDLTDYDSFNNDDMMQITDGSVTFYGADDSTTSSSTYFNLFNLYPNSGTTWNEKSNITTDGTYFDHIAFNGQADSGQPMGFADLKFVLSEKKTYYDLVIDKVDYFDYSKHLENASFYICKPIDIYDAPDFTLQDGTLITEGTQHLLEELGDGKYIIRGLPIDTTFTLIESIPPEGYDQYKSWPYYEYHYNFGISTTDGPELNPYSDENRIKNLQFVNIPKFKVTLTKVSEFDDNTKLIGAEFEVKNRFDRLVSESVDNEDGTYTILIDAERWYTREGEVLNIIETKAPKGSILPENPVVGTFSVPRPSTMDPNDPTELDKMHYELTVENTTDYIDLEIEKVDKDDETTKVSNASFDVINNSGFTIELKDGTKIEDRQTITTIKTDSEGKAKVTDLPAHGKYALKETSVDKPYVLLEEEVEFVPLLLTPTTEKTEDTNAVYNMTIYNQQGKEIIVSKTDLNGKELKGAKIQILSDDIVVEEWTTSNKPQTIYLLPGTYIFHEVSAPDGYDIVADIVFTVNEDGNVEAKKVDGVVESIDNKLIVTDKEKKKPVKPDVPYTMPKTGV